MKKHWNSVRRIAFDFHETTTNSDGPGVPDVPAVPGGIRSVATAGPRAFDRPMPTARGSRQWYLSSPAHGLLNRYLSLDFSYIVETEPSR